MQPHQQNQSQGQRIEADAQEVVDDLGAQLGQLQVQLASLRAALRGRDTRIEQLQQLLRERVTPETSGEQAGDTPQVVNGASAV